ncbi:Small GTPase superfamily [Aphelenchoides avenae]|nr:Small GTPase superfamily [Aphelenchus avenae]
MNGFFYGTPQLHRASWTTCSGPKMMERCNSQVAPRRHHNRPIIANRTRRSYDLNNGTPKPHEPSQFTIVLMGAPKVGKTTMVNQFLWELFVREYRPTVEEFNWVEYEGDNGELLLQLIDSSGSRDFLAMRYLYIRTGDAFMIVYSMDDPASYAEALTLMEEIRDKNERNVPILLVGNKMDTVKSVNDIPPEHDDLEVFARKRRIETLRISAKNLDQVKQSFWILIDELRLARLAGGEFKLRKRRQSMPSRRTANDLGIDAETLERLVRTHEKNNRNNCCIQ